MTSICPNCTSENTQSLAEIKPVNKVLKISVSEPIGSVMKCNDCERHYNIYKKDEENKKNGIKYFLIRRFNCGGGDYSDIYGFTTDENVAKAMQSVFCDYEEVKMLK